MKNDIETRVISKITYRLIPFLCLLFFVAFLDRVNVGFAALHMNKDLGLSATAFGVGAGLFFVGYFFFEVPSNVLLQKYGARITFGRVMILWGIVSGCFAFVQTETQFFVLRFLLGAAEAGFLPGVIYYFTIWLPAAHRARLIGLFVMMIPASTVVGAPLSTWIIQATDGWFGHAGWQWMFVLEAVPAVVLGVLVFYVLPNRPREVKWLSAEEKAWLEGAISREHSVKAQHLPTGWAKALLNRRTGKILVVYSSIVFAIYAVGFWIPQIVKGFGMTVMQTGLVTAIPYLLACICMVLWARHSDRTRERVWHVALPSWFGAISFVVAYLNLDNPTIAMIALSGCMIGIFCALPPYWTYPTLFFSGPAAAVGIAAVNSIGNLAGYVGPSAVGWLKDLTGHFGHGLLLTGAVLTVGGIAAMALRRDFRLEQLATGAASPEPVGARHDLGAPRRAETV
ncbi:MAG: MFS transporter [Variovorax sp.]|nr:MFS transporter [Variovorax sp.]